MISADSCQTPAFSVTTNAGLYAQTTGVLAGFAFAAMVVLLTPTQAEERRSDHESSDKGALLALFVAFIALILTTFTYSILAGETGAPSRAASEEIVDGLSFGLSIIILLHGISLLMRSGSIEIAAVKTAYIVTAVVLPALAMNFIANGTSDSAIQSAANNGDFCASPSMAPVGSSLTLTLLLILTWARLPKFQPRAWTEWTWPRQHQHIVPIVILIATIINTVVAGDISVASARFLFPHWIIVTYLAITFSLLAFVSLMISFGSVGGDYGRDSVEVTERKLE